MNHVLLLRGVNLGPRNRIAMADLREALGQLGQARTYVQSGNVVLASDRSAPDLEPVVERLIASRFGLDVAVLARSAEEMAAVVARNPLEQVAENPKRYQVSFLRSELSEQEVRRLEGMCVAGERLMACGRELYAWHPDGIGRSKLAAARLDTVATARNWTTVCTLAEMAAQP